MFGLFKKDATDEPERQEPEYPVVADLRIGATLNPVILDIDLARESGESMLLEKMQDTLLINAVEVIELEGIKVCRYLTNSNEMVEVTVPVGTRPEDSDEIILYTRFDQVGFASEQDMGDWLEEGYGHMGQPVFSIIPDEGDESAIEFGRLIHPHSQHWAHPVDLSVDEFVGNPYELDEPIGRNRSDRKMMLFAHDLESIKSHLQLLMELDEQKGVVNLYIGIPVKLKDLNIT